MQRTGRAQRLIGETPDTKAGAKLVPLSTPVHEILVSKTRALGSRAAFARIRVGRDEAR
jgi:hypothetical protein